MTQSTLVMAKPHKVEEPAAPYLAAKTPAPKTPAPVQPAVRVASLEEVRKNNAKLMQVHRKVLQKLAQ